MTGALANKHFISGLRTETPFSLRNIWMTARGYYLFVAVVHPVARWIFHHKWVFINIFIREKSICKRLFSGRIILTKKSDNPRFRSRGELISVTPAAFEIAPSSLLLPIFFKSATRSLQKQSCLKVTCGNTCVSDRLSRIKSHLKTSIFTDHDFWEFPSIFDSGEKKRSSWRLYWQKIMLLVMV